MNSSGHISVQGGRSIYYESYGKIGVIPVVILHGGPGGGMNKNSLSLYDLKTWFVVMFDQRKPNENKKTKKPKKTKPTKTNKIFCQETSDGSKSSPRCLRTALFDRLYPFAQGNYANAP